MKIEIEYNAADKRIEELEQQIDYLYLHIQELNKKHKAEVSELKSDISSYMLTAQKAEDRLQKNQHAAQILVDLIAERLEDSEWNKYPDVMPETKLRTEIDADGSMWAWYSTERYLITATDGNCYIGYAEKNGADDKLQWHLEDSDHNVEIKAWRKLPNAYND